MIDQAPAGTRILVVEDEPRLAAIVCDYLKAAGYDTDWVADGAQAMDQFRANQPSLVLLDLMLPNRNGVDICLEIRAESDVPVIMLTARVEEVDRLLGLGSGADDYICKPFSPREVVARVGVVLRRYRGPQTQQVLNLQLDETNFCFALQDKWQELTPVEFRLLRTLASPPLRIWSRDQLMNHLYPDNRIVTDRTVDSHVRNLRRKLIDAGAKDEPIRSIYGVGYRLDC